MIRKLPFLHRFLNKNTQESGRSMVEILGVLAVIGVLTIGGIYGYQLALNKYIANETIHELNMRASNISYKMEKLIEANYIGEIDMELGNVTRWGYPIMARMSPQYIDYFEIFLSDVPSDICKLLLQSHWVAPYSVFVGITEYTGNAQICDSEESVELVYEFYKDMTQKEEIEEENRHKTDRCRHDNDCRCGTCGNGLCVTFCTSEEQCVKDSDNPQQLVCCSHDNVLGELCCNSIEDGKCCNIMGQCCLPETPLWDINGVCHACDEDNLITVENSYLCGSICENRTVMSGKYCSLKCHKNEFKNTSGTCLSCTDAGNYWTMATKAECDKCPDRVLGYYQNNKCMLKCNTPGTYTEGKPLHNLDGICFTCITSEKVDMRGGDDSRCKKECPNRILIGQKCLLKDYCTTTEKPLMDENGNCYACDTPQALPKQDKCTTACPRERKVASDGKCVLNDCGSGKFRTSENTCSSCTDAGNYWTMATKAECDKCPERVLGYYQNNKCMLKCNTSGTYTEGKPLHNLDGICFTCITSEKVDMRGGDDSRCKKECPNRILIGQQCFLKDYCITTEKPLMDENGNCYACNTPQALPKQEKCTTACPTERKVTSDGKCVLNTCEKNQFKSNENTCLSCTDAGNYWTMATKAECDKCPERVLGYYQNNKCMLKCDTPGTYTEGKPLHNLDGICYSCNERSSLNMLGGDPSRCETICPNRTLVGNECVFRECSTGMFSGNDNVCYTCNITTPIATTPTECERCLNRKYGTDGYCSLNNTQS